MDGYAEVFSDVLSVKRPQASIEAETRSAPFGALGGLSRPEALRNLRRSHYALVSRDRVGQIPLPSGFTVTNVMARLRELNEDASSRASTERVDELTLEILEAQGDSERPIAERLEDEAAAREAKSRLLREQRATSERWTFACVIRGNIPMRAESIISRSFYWERIGWSVSDLEVTPPGLERVKGAPTQKQAAAATRELRARWGQIAEAQDRVLSYRERLVLLFDTWNSGAPERVYTLKPWNRERVKPDWEERLAQLEEATRVLQAVALSSVPREHLPEGFAQPAWADPLPSSLLEAWTSESVH